MAKYSKMIVEKICSLIQSDSYTIPEICQLVGIAESTFHEWKASKPEFSEAIKKARAAFFELLSVEAKKSLMKKVKGYEVEETKTVYVDSGKSVVDENGKEKQKPKVKEKTIVTKHIQPDTAAIIFTLTNTDPDHWKNRQSSDVNGAVHITGFENWTEKQLEDFVNGKD